MRPSLIGLALLTACVSDPADVAPMPVDLAPPSSTMTLDMGNIVVGSPLDITVTGASPGATVQLIRSTGGIGGGPCPSFLGGNCMDILPGPQGYIPTLTATADSAGNVVWSFPRFPSVPPTVLSMQAVVLDGADSNESNALERTVHPACVDDPFEDNDSPQQAYPTPPGLYVQQIVCSETDADWYAIEVPLQQRLEISADFDPLAGDIDLRLFGPGGNEVDSAENLSTPERVSWFNDTGADATVLLEASLFRDGFAQAGATYALDVDLVLLSPCPTDVFEPNDEPLTATTITEGSRDGIVCLNDTDWFRFDAVAGDVIDASVSFDTSGGTDVDMNLFDPTGALLAEADFNFSSPDPLQYRATTTGPLFLQVYLSEDDLFGVGADYTLDLQTTTPAPCLPDNAEPDDTPATASFVTPGDYSATACLGDTDWFALNMLPGEQLAVTVTWPAAGQNIDLNVYDSTGLALSATDDFGSPEELIYDAITGGPVYVEVVLTEDDTLGGGADYTLDLSVTTPSTCASDAFEPNDILADAVPQVAGPAGSPSTWQGTACLGDIDLFTFDVLPGDVIDAEAIFETRDGDVDMNLYSAAGVLLASADFDNTSPDPLQFQTRAAGTLTLEVLLETDDPNGGGADYEVALTVQQPAACPVDAFEPNNTPATATAISGDISATACLTDVDLYAIAANAGDRIVLSVDAPISLGNVDLRLLAPNGSLLTDGDDLTWDVTQSGTYRAEVSLANDDLYGGGNDYDLNLFVGDPNCSPDSYEPNEEPGSAIPLAPGAYPRLTLCSDLEEDWFEVSLAAGQTLEVTASFSDAEGDLDLRLRNASDTTTLDSSTTSNDVEEVSYTATTAEVVLVRVDMWREDGVLDGNTYDLEITRTP